MAPHKTGTRFLPVLFLLVLFGATGLLLLLFRGEKGEDESGVAVPPPVQVELTDEVLPSLEARSEPYPAPTPDR
jgi:hypothetical protein